MANSPLIKKLLIKPGQRVVVLNPPAGYVEGLAPLPEGVEVSDQPAGGADAVHLFVKNREEFDRLAAVAIAAVKRDGLLWIAYPKGGKRAGTDVNRDILWAAIVEQYGWSGVAMVAIDDVWSAMRFRPADQVGR